MDREKAEGERPIYGNLLAREEVLDSLHDGLAAQRIRRFEQVLRQRCGSVHVLLEEVDDKNSTACMRTAEAYGVQHVHLVDSSDEPVKGKRHDSSMSSSKWLSVHRYTSSWPAVKVLREQKFALFAVVHSHNRMMPLEGCEVPDSVSIDSIDFHAYDKVCMMFGSDERGLSSGLRTIADSRIFIPLRGSVMSMNLSTEFAVVTYHLHHKKRLRPDLPEDEIADNYRHWVYRASSKRKQLPDELRRMLPRMIRDTGAATAAPSRGVGAPDKDSS